MRIEPHANLTITLLHRHLFGSDRLAGSVPRREVPIDGLIQADRLRCPPPCVPITTPPSSTCPEVTVIRCEPHRPDAAAGIVTSSQEQAASTLAPATYTASGDPAWPASATAGNLLDVWA